MFFLKHFFGRTVYIMLFLSILFLFLDKVERKGSCDSLASQRSSDSQSSAPVRDTLYRAKKQIQALMGQFQ